MFKELLATLLLSGSIGAKTQTIKEPRRLDNDIISVYGNYNFNNTFVYNGDGSLDGWYYIYFEDISDEKHYINPISCTAWGSHYYYLTEIEIYLDANNVELYLDYYDVYSTGHIELDFSNEDTLADFNSGYRDVILQFSNQYILHDDLAVVFDIFFTKEDNVYVKSYDGYYSFLNNLTDINNNFFVHGSINFNNKLSRYMTNCTDGMLGGNTSSFVCSYFDVIYLYYIPSVYSLPLNKNDVTSNQLLLSNCKMSLNSYNTLSQVGSFTYVRDNSYDNTNFHDLIFTLMDSPIYMLSRLLSFELFGMNLFIALCGLLTLILIVALIKKII